MHPKMLFPGVQEWPGLRSTMCLLVTKGSPKSMPCACLLPHAHVRSRVGVIGLCLSVEHSSSMEHFATRSMLTRIGSSSGLSTGHTTLGNSTVPLVHDIVKLAHIKQARGGCVSNREWRCKNKIAVIIVHHSTVVTPFL